MVKRQIVRMLIVITLMPTVGRPIAAYLATLLVRVTGINLPYGYTLMRAVAWGIVLAMLIRLAYRLPFVARVVWRMLRQGW